MPFKVKTTGKRGDLDVGFSCVSFVVVVVVVVVDNIYHLPLTTLSKTFCKEIHSKKNLTSY